MNVTNPKLLTDLEIYNKILPAIDRTITSYGQVKLKQLFNTIHYDKNYLYNNKQKLVSIINSHHIRKIINHLKKIKKLENNVKWFFSDNKKKYCDLTFKTKCLNIKELINIKNFLKIYSPSFVIIIYLLIYIILRYYGINIQLKNYFVGIYNSYRFYIQIIVTLLLKNINLASFVANILATTYIVYQLYTIYNSIDGSLIHYRKCKEFKDNIHGVIKVLELSNNIYKMDTFTFKRDHVGMKIVGLSGIFKTTSLGYSTKIKDDNRLYEPDFNYILQYIGLVDAYISISKLIILDGYKFPQFDFNSSSPYIYAKNVWNPILPRYNQTVNDCYLGNFNNSNNFNGPNGSNISSKSSIPNSMIITGPNTSGKSTYIRSIMLAVLLSQTIGVCNCDNILLTPFVNLFTYIDIPNISRINESLFEAEIKRCIEYCNILENTPPNNFVLTVMDELFTGTNPKEGIAGSYGVCEYLGRFINGLLIITTHFVELTELANEYSELFMNKKFIINKKDGNLIRPFKIYDGVSDQNIAIELLERKGYNNEIIEGAKNKLAILDQ